MDQEFDHGLDELREDGSSRRDFIKKAGTVAWVVPTLQVVNMASAAAGAGGQTAGSVVDTTTSRPPNGCSDYVYIKVEAFWHCEDNENPDVADDRGDGCEDGYWSWGLGERGCIPNDRADYHIVPDGLPIWIAPDSNQEHVTVYHEMEHCRIVAAKTYLHEQCRNGEISENGAKAGFWLPQQDGDNNGRPHGLRHVEFMLKCCEKHTTVRDA